MSEKMIVRHEPPAIFMHWFNAACWFFLLLTGLALIKNPQLQFMGQWYPEAVRWLFGGGDHLLYAHISVGVIWGLVWVVFAAVYWNKYTVPFLADMFNLKIPRDLHWMVKKQLQMVLGYKLMGRIARRLGMDARIPDQGFYNTGQKAAAVPLILGGIVLAATGVIMAVSSVWLEPRHAPLVQWSILIHFLAAGFTFALLIIHIYMASISREERPAFWSMFTGVVPEHYARHHHKLWYDRLARSSKNQN